MRQALRFVVALVAGLALLTWGAAVLVSRTTRAWFENDMQLRAQLAVSGAREALASHWGAGQVGELRKILLDLTRDERVLGAAACDADLAMKARTTDFPPPLGCGELGLHVRPTADSSAIAWAPWASVFSVPGGQVHATAVPLVEAEQPLGFVVLVHDLSFVERREDDDDALPRRRVRLPGLRGVDHHPRRRPAVVARLEQRAAAAHPRREGPGPSSGPSCGTSGTSWSGSPRSERPTAWAACGRRSGSRTR